MGINNIPLYRTVGSIGLSVIIFGLFVQAISIASSTTPSKLLYLISFIITIIGFMITMYAIFHNWSEE